MKLLLPLFFLISFTFAYKTFKGVIVADDKNFEQIIHTKGKYTFINFYSMRCEHCQKIGPRYEALATAFKDTDVQIVQLEGRENRRIRNQEGIVGFPTLRLYHFDGTHIASFPANRERTTEEMAAFLNEHTGVKPHWPESRVTVVHGSEEVQNVIDANEKRVVVAFTAPWLQNWSDRFNEYERLATTFPDVAFYKLDATLEENSEIVSKYRVSVYPTLVYIDAADAPKFRMLEEHEASQKKMAAFLRIENGEDYDDMEDLYEEKSMGQGDDGAQPKVYGFHKYADANDQSEDDEEERYKKLREL